MTHSIVLLPGDGVGPEVTAAARRVLDAAAAAHGLHLAFAEHLVGGAAIDAAGEPLPGATLDACLAAAEFPDVQLEHGLVDSAAMRLITHPGDYDVLLTENLFGDILSDEASVLAGSIGVLGSASLGEPGRPGLFEPIHGSAPDIAGRDLANPLGAITAAAMLLRDGLGAAQAAASVERAVGGAIDAGEVTPDLGGALGCRAAARAVAERVAA